MRSFSANSHKVIWFIALTVIFAGLSSCRSLSGTREGSVLLTVDERDTSENYLPPPLAEKCFFKKNDNEIPRFCYHSQTEGCISGHGAGSIIVLSCRDGEHKGMDLARISLRFSDFLRSNFEGANLTQTDLLGSHGDWAKFHKAKARESVFSFAILIGAEFHEALLHYSDFRHAQLLRSSFEKARLRGANFHSAELRESSFEGANLVGVSFVLADLKNVSFVNADLFGADFTSANLEGANFEGAENIERALGLPADLMTSQADKKTSSSPSASAASSGSPAK